MSDKKRKAVPIEQDEDKTDSDKSHGAINGNDLAEKDGAIVGSFSSGFIPKVPHPAVAKLKELSFTTLPDNFFIIFYGVRRTGKTHALTCLLEEIKDRFDYAYLFSDTADIHIGEPGFANFDMIRPEAKFSGYDELALQEIMRVQQARKKKNNTCTTEKDKQPNRTIVIFDDFVHKKEVRYSETFTMLPVLGRHMDLSVICLSQGYASVASGGLNIATRQNTDMVLTFLPRSMNNKEHISDQYLTESKFSNMWFISSACEAKHQCLAIQLDQPHLTDLHEYCYKYKAPAKLPTYELGKVQWMLFHEEEKRAKIAAQMEDMKRNATVIVPDDKDHEFLGLVAGEATGLPPRRTKLSLYDSFLAAQRVQL